MKQPAPTHAIPGRRQLAQAAAWGIPVIAAATALPAQASSPTCPGPTNILVTPSSATVAVGSCVTVLITAQRGTGVLANTPIDLVAGTYTSSSPLPQPPAVYPTIVGAGTPTNSDPVQPHYTVTTNALGTATIDVCVPVGADPRGRAFVYATSLVDNACFKESSFIRVTYAAA